MTSLDVDSRDRDRDDHQCSANDLPRNVYPGAPQLAREAREADELEAKHADPRGPESEPRPLDRDEERDHAERVAQVERGKKRELPRREQGTLHGAHWSEARDAGRRGWHEFAQGRHLSAGRVSGNYVWRSLLSSSLDGALSSVHLWTVLVRRRSPRRRRDPLWLPRGAATTAASAVNKRGATVRTNALAAAQAAPTPAPPTKIRRTSGPAFRFAPGKNAWPSCEKTSPNGQKNQ